MVNKIIIRGVQQGESSIRTKHLYVVANKGFILYCLNVRLDKFVVDTTTKDFWEKRWLTRLKRG